MIMNESSTSKYDIESTKVIADTEEDSHSSDDNSADTTDNATFDDVELSIKPADQSKITQQKSYCCPSSRCGRLICAVCILIPLIVTTVLLIQPVCVLPYPYHEGMTELYPTGTLQGGFAALSHDGNTMAISTVLNQKDTDDNRVIQVYRNRADNDVDGIRSHGIRSHFEPIGQALEFDHASDNPVELSNDGNTLALATASDTVQVLVFDEESNHWLERLEVEATRKQPIMNSGEGPGKRLSQKTAVALSGDALTLVIVTEGSQNGVASSSVDIYNFNGTDWNVFEEGGIILPDIFVSIEAIDLSFDGKTFAITGSDTNDVSRDSILLVYKLLPLVPQPDLPIIEGRSDSSTLIVGKDEQQQLESPPKTSIWIEVGTVTHETTAMPSMLFDDHRSDDERMIIEDIALSNDGNTLAVATHDTVNVYTFNGQIYQTNSQQSLLPAMSSSVAQISAVAISESDNGFSIVVGGGEGIVEYYRQDQQSTTTDNLTWEREKQLVVNYFGEEEGNPAIGTMRPKVALSELKTTDFTTTTGILVVGPPPSSDTVSNKGEVYIYGIESWEW